jgi:3-deoxy-D-manno-octulosonate 8-phosphate phosphatase (KDO 8-P phosphatase)
MRRAAGIRVVVFDVDGVLTDGRLLLGGDGLELKAFHVRDGFGLKLLRESGVEVGVISARRSPVVAERMESLGVVHVYQGHEDKLGAFHDLLSRLGLEAESAAYLGDDLVDGPVLRAVGLAVAVADAHPRVRALAHWITPSPGGAGAARELCELVLAAQGRLAALEARYVG